MMDEKYKDQLNNSSAAATQSKSVTDTRVPAGQHFKQWRQRFDGVNKEFMRLFGPLYANPFNDRSAYYYARHCHFECPNRDRTRRYDILQRHLPLLSDCHSPPFFKPNPSTDLKTQVTKCMKAIREDTARRTVQSQLCLTVMKQFLDVL